jgi:hypothetical protein
MVVELYKEEVYGEEFVVLRIREHKRCLQLVEEGRMRHCEGREDEGISQVEEKERYLEFALCVEEADRVMNELESNIMSRHKHKSNSFNLFSASRIWLKHHDLVLKGAKLWLGVLLFFTFRWRSSYPFHLYFLHIHI